MQNIIRQKNLIKFGFGFKKRSVHVARTIMLKELTDLISAVPEPINQADYIHAIIEENCLRKRSLSTRKITADQLIQLYTIDPDATIFRSMLFFWKRDEDGRPLLALLCAFTRDILLRQTAKLIFDTREGEIATSDVVEGFIDSLEPGRFSKITLGSMGRNVRSSWTKSGHLTGHGTKIRKKAKATSGTTAFALLLGYLNGVRGIELFETDYVKILDCNREEAIELAERASMSGWIVFKRLGNVIEVLFPNLLNEQEVTWLYEQNESPIK